MERREICSIGLVSSGLSDTASMDAITDYMHGSSDFQIIGTIDGEQMNHQLNAFDERYNHESPIVQAITDIGEENINKNGVLIHYIPIETHHSKDPIKGDPVNKTAVGIFSGLKIYSDSNELPTFVNMKTNYDHVNYLNDFLMYGHKGDFRKKTSAQITEMKKINNYWKDKTDYIPQPGDIIVIETDYKVAFEVTDVDDDSFMYLLVRDYYSIMLQHWTRQLIDFSLIQDKLIELDLAFILPNYTLENVMESNNMIKANGVVSKEDNPLILEKPPISHNETTFDKILGTW